MKDFEQSKYLEEIMVLGRYDKINECRKWAQDMPALHFKEEWDVKIIPPFGGAVTGFTVDYNGNHVSVYFDAYSRLGHMYEGENPIPYFELYPFEGDVKRYYINGTEELINDIAMILEVTNNVK